MTADLNFKLWLSWDDGGGLKIYVSSAALGLLGVNRQYVAMRLMYFSRRVPGVPEMRHTNGAN